MSNTKVSREEIELLRASASSLIEDTAEPCWGLAQRLSQLAERLVIESGERAATFGRGGADALDGPCCPACGWWDDMHAAWCIHAYEDQADEPAPAATSEPEAYPVHYSGCCPICHQEPVLYFAEDHSEYMVCEKHRKAWYVGRGNCSAWQHMTKDDLWGQDFFLSVECEIIPAPECTCSCLPAEPEPSSELEGLLTWLDLSSLPPVPPAEPPARKPTNWRFDAPDNGQAQEPGGPF